MSNLEVINNKLPTQFEPEQTFTKQAQLDAIIDLARKTKNWDALEEAVEIKISEQKECVEAWDKAVTPRKYMNRHSVDVTDTVTSMSVEKAEEVFGFTKMQMSRMRKNVSASNEAAYREKLYGAAYRKAFPLDSIADKMTGDEESYTPEQYLESARKVMGGIDLDPASNDMAQEDVQAGTYYTVEHDGLSKEWFGRMWMNPPYTARVINQFIDKAVKHFHAGEISQAIILTNNNTDTSWFHQGAGASSAICFTAGRINFLKRDGSTSSPTNGQSFFYLGDDVDKFKAEFSQYGLVMVKA